MCTGQLGASAGQVSGEEHIPATGTSWLCLVGRLWAAALGYRVSVEGGPVGVSQAVCAGRMLQTQLLKPLCLSWRAVGRGCLPLLFPVSFPGPDWYVLGEEVWGTTGHSCSPTLDPFLAPSRGEEVSAPSPHSHPQSHTPSPPRPQVLLTHLLDDSDHPAAPQLLQGGAQCANGPEPQAAETLQRWERDHRA